MMKVTVEQNAKSLGIAAGKAAATLIKAAIDDYKQKNRAGGK